MLLLKGRICSLWEQILSNSVASTLKSIYILKKQIFGLPMKIAAKSPSVCVSFNCFVVQAIVQAA